MWLFVYSIIMQTIQSGSSVIIVRITLHVLSDSHSGKHFLRQTKYYGVLYFWPILISTMPLYPQKELIVHFFIYV